MTTPHEGELLASYREIGLSSYLDWSLNTLDADQMTAAAARHQTRIGVLQAEMDEDAQNPAAHPGRHASEFDHYSEIAADQIAQWVLSHAAQSAAQAETDKYKQKLAYNPESGLQRID